MKYDIEVDALVKIGRNLFTIAAILDDERIVLHSGSVVRKAGVEVVGSAATGRLYRQALDAQAQRKMTRLARQLIRDLERIATRMGR